MCLLGQGRALRPLSKHLHSHFNSWLPQFSSPCYVEEKDKSVCLLQRGNVHQGSESCAKSPNNHRSKCLVSHYSKNRAATGNYQQSRRNFIVRGTNVYLMSNNVCTGFSSFRVNSLILMWCFFHVFLCVFVCFRCLWPYCSTGGHAIL